ncbi:MAG: RNA polymerase factor sigma-54, partial [Candidatus Omnitrophica bacterium]|nr:RNA polymerase factor sigma-54 [Candidatus Omnitrophota bacterium]
SEERYDQDEDRRRKRMEDLVVKLPTLYGHLMKQLDMFSRSDEEKNIGETIICNIDENGYLRASMEELTEDQGVSTEEIEKTLSLIQTFSPPGVSARNLSECLYLQLVREGRENSLAGKIVKRHLDDLGKKKFKQIAKDLKVSIDEVQKAFSVIHRLDPKPGSAFGACAREITPDILLHPSENSYKIEISNENIPELRISPYYKKLLKNKDTPEETKEYIKKKLNQAMWLIRAVQQRYDTIKKVVGCIVIAQKDFLDNDNDPEFIKPLTLKEVARAVGVSESTVSRVVANKHIDTPAGIFGLKRFFSSQLKQDENGSLSSENVKMKIRELVRNEKPGRPLSDEAIVKALHSEGINIARRTVTKYREALKIPSSSQRRYSCLD